MKTPLFPCPDEALHGALLRGQLASDLRQNQDAERVLVH